MSRFYKYPQLFAALFLLFLLAAPALAQVPAPPDDDTEGPTEEDTDAARERLKQQRAKAIERERLRPVLEAIAETRPTSPVELMKTIETLMNLGAPDEARVYMQRLLALKLDDEALYVLQRKVGSGIFFRLSQDDRFQPEGRQLAEAVLSASFRQARDPRRMANLVQQLNDPAPEIRQSAINDLKDAGSAAIGPMIEVLSDEGRSAEHARVRFALAQMGTLAVEPLIAAIATPNHNLRAQVIEILGMLQAPRASQYLIHPLLSNKHTPQVNRAAAVALRRIVGEVPTVDDAEIYLRNRANAHFGGELPRLADGDGNIQLWLWHPKQNKPVPVLYPAHDAALVVAAQLATDLYDLWPKDIANRNLYLAAILESAKVVHGMDKSLPLGAGTARDLAAQAGPAAVEQVLVEAIQNDRLPAAIAAAEVLGDIGSVQLLMSDDGRPRPLVEALRHRNRRLRFVAAEAIVKIDPQHDYPGSSHLPETLGYLAATAGSRKVLIGHPRAEQAQSLVGMLSEMGLEGDVALTGRRLMALAAQSPDYEVILLSDAIDHPPLRETLQMIRRDHRVGGLPVGLMVREDRLNQLQLLAGDERLTEAFPRPHDTKALQFQIARLLQRAGRDVVPYEQRRAQGAAALAWLSRMAEEERRYRFYDLLRQMPAVIRAALGPELTPRACEVLGFAGTPAAQRTLVTVASQSFRPLGDRQAAAKAFATAVSRRGVLLRDDEIDLQYERYNQSELLDAGTQQVLGQILDTIEMRLAAQGETKQPVE